jgi:hypothetical protein
MQCWWNEAEWMLDLWYENAIANMQLMNTMATLS